MKTKKTTERDWGFANRLIDAMAKKHVRCGKLAEDLGFPARTLSMYTSGQCYPGVHRAIDMARYLDVTVEWLITGEKNDQV